MNKLKTLKLNRISNLEKKLIDQDLRGYDHYVFIDGNRKAQLITNGKWVTEFIRTAVIKNDIVKVRAGGGIVHDSDPESEYQESLNKAQSIFWTFSILMGLSMASIFIVYTDASIARVFFI